MILPKLYLAEASDESQPISAASFPADAMR